MIEPERTIEHQLVFLRWALIASLAYMILVGQTGQAQNPYALAYVGFLLATNLVIPRLPYRNPRTFGSVLLGLDTVFVLVGVLLCDSRSQELLIGYFLCIVMAAFGDSELRLAGAAFLVTGAYTVWISRSWTFGNHAELLLRLPFLFVTTLFYGYMMQRVRNEQGRRLQAERRAQDLDCLLQITRSFSSSLAMEDVLARVSDTIRATLAIDRCTIELLRTDGGAPRAAVATRALERRAPVLDRDPDDDVAILALPIIHDVEPFGVLIVRADHVGQRFDDYDVELCEIVAHAAASALKNARTYEDLLEIERAKSEFLSNLSHELRTPLNTIIGFTELAQERAEKVAADAEIHDLLDRALNGANEMTRNVESLLDLSDATLGRERHSLRRVDLDEMLRRNVAQARRVQPKHTVDFSVEVAPDLHSVYTDGEKLERIVGNLLMNAAKFTREGSVRVVASLVPPAHASGETLPRPLRPWERLLSVSIQDTGVGIAPKDMERLFLDFRQANGGTNRRFGGLGIGLSIARRLVERLGGAIRVQSRIEEGSRFLVLVPVQTAASGEA